MKIPPYFLSLVGVVSALVGPLNAEVFLYDFESQAVDDRFDGDVSGWSQDTANPEAFGTVFPLGYVSTVAFGGPGSDTNAGFLGTYRGNTPDNSSTTLTGDLSSLGASIPSSAISLNLGILDDSTDPFGTRDVFSVVLLNASNTEAARIDLIPDTLDNTLWNVSIGVNGNPTTTTSSSLGAGFGYQIAFEFDDSETNFLYRSSVSGGSYVGLGSLDPVTSGSLGAIQLAHHPQGVPGTSANALVFDNIAAIPEPSSALGLLFILVGALGGRHRRSSGR